MTTYPSQYQATLKNPIPFYGPSAKELDEQLVVYGTCMGISYIGPYLQFPQPFRSSTE